MAQTKLNSLARALLKVCIIVGTQSPLLDDFETFFKKFNAISRDSNKKQTSTNKLRVFQ